MAWNRQSGNAYTASLWIAAAHALAGRAVGESVLAFSYGSGFGSELLTLTAGPDAAAGDWTDAVAADLATRRVLDAGAYEDLRADEGLRHVAK